MSDLAVDAATLGLVAAIALLTWAVARSMRAQLSSPSRPDVPVLTVTSEGRLHGLTVQVDRPVTVGRSATADIQVTDGYASDAHARVEPSTSGAVVVDLESTNGTFVNEERIEAPTELRRGDTVRIGTTIMEVR